MTLSRNYEGSSSVGNSRQKKEKKTDAVVHTTNVKPTGTLSLKTQNKRLLTDNWLLWRQERIVTVIYAVHYWGTFNPFTSPLKIFHRHFQVKFLAFTYQSVKLWPPLKKPWIKKESFIVIVSKSKRSLYSS